jgi:hypothetical protein
MIHRMDVVTQWVRTSWTKRARGGPEAARRNAVPVAFPLPGAAGGGETRLVHEVEIREWADFQPQETVRAGLPDPDQVALREIVGVLHVELKPVPGGNPNRWYRTYPQTGYPLRRGQWLRWQINYRFGSTWSNDGFYRLDTLNLAFGRSTEHPFPGLPAHAIDDRAHLL